MSELVVEGLRAAVDGQGILKGVDLVVKSAAALGIRDLCAEADFVCS